MPVQRSGHGEPGCLAWVKQGDEAVGGMHTDDEQGALRSLTAEVPVAPASAMGHLVCCQGLVYHSIQRSHKSPMITLTGIDLVLQNFVG